MHPFEFCSLRRGDVIRDARGTPHISYLIVDSCPAADSGMWRVSWIASPWAGGPTRGLVSVELPFTSSFIYSTDGAVTFVHRGRA